MQRYKISVDCTTNNCPSFSTCARVVTEVWLDTPQSPVDVVFISNATRYEAASRVPCDGKIGAVFRKMVLQAESELGKPVNKAFMCLTRTGGQNDETWPFCKKHLIRDIERLKPKLIVTLGPGPTTMLMMDKYSREFFMDNRSHLMHTRLNGKMYQVLPILDPNRVFLDPSHLCCIMEDLRRAVGVYTYKPMVEAQERVVPRTVKEVYEVLCQISNTPQEAVAYDTETKNLNRRYGNSLDSVQFCSDPKTAYFVFVSHPNTPFDPVEQQKVKALLHRFFMKRNHAFRYFVAHNAKYDIGVVFSLLKARIALPVICTMTFPFILEENYIDSTTGDFALKSLSKKFGFKGFGAEELLARGAGKLHDLSPEKFINYATNDVVATIQLYYILKNMAQGQKYLSQAMNLLVHFFSRVYKLLMEMEYNGIPIDFDRLLNLRSPSSPILARMKEILEVDFPALPSVQKANALLASAACEAPSLFDDDTPWVFNFYKVAHKQLLYFGVLELEPLSPVKSPKLDSEGRLDIAGESVKVGKMDRNFQDTYREECPEVGLLYEYNKLKKLKTSYVDAIVRFLDPKNKHQDYYTDNKVRPEFRLTAKTGRARTKNPNSQQIPHGDTPVSKEVKNLFYAPPGWAIIALDYMAIEVRVWGVLSQDKAMAEMFKEAKHYRNLWRTTGNPEYKKKAKLLGDIHTVNSSAMYGVPLDQVTAIMRGSSKGLTFGSIYGRSLASMARGMGCTVEEAELRKAKAFAKFKEAGAWLTDVEKLAQAQLYVESPLGRRRHLWEFLLADPKYVNRARRQARNSPIQGTASDITFYGASLMHEEYIVPNQKPWEFFNAVHDAMYLRAPLPEIRECVLVAEKFFTESVFEHLQQDFGFTAPFPLEAEFEIGISGGDLEKWDFSEQHLDQIIGNIQKLDAERSKIIKKPYRLEL